MSISTLDAFTIVVHLLERRFFCRNPCVLSTSRLLNTFFNTLNTFRIARSFRLFGELHVYHCICHDWNRFRFPPTVPSFLVYTMLDLFANNQDHWFKNSILTCVADCTHEQKHVSLYTSASLQTLAHPHTLTQLWARAKGRKVSLTIPRHLPLPRVLRLFSSARI